MVAHHEPLRALGPIEWDEVPVDDLKTFMNEAFVDAQTVVESVPAPTTASATGAAAAPAGAVFEQAEKAYSQNRQPGSSLALAQQLRKEWKEIKMNARDNPLNISVYKLAAKDGKGAWFARRSVHHGLTYDNWKTGLEKEFPETLKVQGSPGSGNIRGVGADRHVESREVEDSGHLSGECYCLPMIVSCASVDSNMSVNNSVSTIGTIPWPYGPERLHYASSDDRL